MHVCHSDPEERKRRTELLHNRGVIVQLDDGNLKPVSPEEATERISAMEPDHYYCRVDAVGGATDATLLSLRDFAYD